MYISIVDKHYGGIYLFRRLLHFEMETLELFEYPVKLIY
jgi:hypothetical protein